VDLRTDYLPPPQRQRCTPPVTRCNNAIRSAISSAGKSSRNDSRQPSPSGNLLWPDGWTPLSRFRST